MIDFTKSKTKGLSNLFFLNIGLALKPPPPIHSVRLTVNYLFVLASNIKVYLKHDEFVKYYAPAGNKVKKAFFRVKVTVKVTSSSNLLSFERASLVEYLCQI